MVSFLQSIRVFESVSSTQDIVKKQAAAGAPEGLVIQTREQTGGYGRHGRRWVSPPGNLYLSILLRPQKNAQEVAQLSLVTGLAVAETIEKYINSPQSVKLKWPNDVFLQDKKCAGILVETELTGNFVKWLALGVGINICSAPHEIDAIALQGHAGIRIELPDFRDCFLQCFEILYQDWQSEPFSVISNKWMKKSYRPGTPISIKTPQFMHGFFEGIDEAGNLLMRDQNKTLHTITAGNIVIQETVHAVSD